MKTSLETARHNFRMSWGVASTAPIEIIPSDPKDVVRLQEVDYFLWALQRFYERDEDRFLNLLWSSVGLIRNVDDTREAGYGVYYTQSKPLTLEVREKK